MPGQEWSAMHAYEPAHALPIQKWFLPAVISHVIKHMITKNFLVTCHKSCFYLVNNKWNAWESFILLELLGPFVSTFSGRWESG